MLGRDQAFTMVPFFWTKHFDLSIRYVGHAAKWDEVRVEGDLARPDGLVRFRRAGRDFAVATVERDNESLRAELAMAASLARPLSACGQAARGDLQVGKSLTGMHSSYATSGSAQ
jgi:apoptosis-inducing factor 3